MTARIFNRSDVVFTTEPLDEDHPPDYELADGSPDTEQINAILASAEQSPWGWCVVKVTAKWGGFKGSGYLGGIHIPLNVVNPEEDFQVQMADYYQTLRDEAVEALKKTINDAGWEFEEGTG